jgi:hypothetical protein
MSDQYQDPSGNTQAFRAFVQRDEPAAPTRSNRTLIIGGVVAAVVVIALVIVAVLALG